MVEGLTLQDVQTDSAKAVDVGVVYLGKEADLGRGHGIVVRQEELELEDSTWRSGSEAAGAEDQAKLAYLRREIAKGREF